MVPFMNLSDRGDGFMLRLHNILSETFPDIKINYNALKHCVQALVNDEMYGAMMVKYMKEWKNDGRLEHLSIGNTKNKALSCIKWTFNGYTENGRQYLDSQHHNFWPKLCLIHFRR